MNTETKDSNASVKPEGLIQKKTVAERLCKTEKTVERWMHDGIIPYIKLGRGRRATVLFKWETVERCLQERFGVNMMN